jgi:hypothetical protein
MVVAKLTGEDKGNSIMVAVGQDQMQAAIGNRYQWINSSL